MTPEEGNERKNKDNGNHDSNLNGWSHGRVQRTGRKAGGTNHRKTADKGNGSGDGSGNRTAKAHPSCAFADTAFSRCRKGDKGRASDWRKTHYPYDRYTLSGTIPDGPGGYVSVHGRARRRKTDQLRMGDHRCRTGGNQASESGCPDYQRRLKSSGGKEEP